MTNLLYGKLESSRRKAPEGKVPEQLQLPEPSILGAAAAKVQEEAAFFAEPFFQWCSELACYSKASLVEAANKGFVCFWTNGTISFEELSIVGLNGVGARVDENGWVMLIFEEGEIIVHDPMDRPLDLNAKAREFGLIS